MTIIYTLLYIVAVLLFVVAICNLIGYIHDADLEQDYAKKHDNKKDEK